MSKFWPITLLVLLLLAPQVELEAKGKHHYRQATHKYMGFPHSTKAELESLKQSISVVNQKVDELKQKVGDRSGELEGALNRLQSIVADNSSDLSLAFEDITRALVDIENIILRLHDDEGRLGGLETTVGEIGFNLGSLEARVNHLEDRILALEEGAPPADTNVIFSGAFTGGQIASDVLVQAWSQFRNDAIGSFSSIEIKNSLNGSVVCDDPVVVNQIASELNGHVPVQESITSFDCKGLAWNVGNCAVAGIPYDVELNAGVAAKVCGCNQNATVRPGIGNESWGGIGVTCKAPSQTLEVILTL